MDDTEPTITVRLKLQATITGAAGVSMCEFEPFTLTVRDSDALDVVLRRYVLAPEDNDDLNEAFDDLAWWLVQQYRDRWRERLSAGAGQGSVGR